MPTKLFAEFVGTFILVFAGTAAVIVNSMCDNAITHPGIALVFGLVVLALAYTFGDVSGAHINPAVTLGFAVAKRLPWRDVPGYIIVQCLGALAASFLLSKMFPDGLAVNFGATIPFKGYVDESFVLEIWLTWALMLVILHVSTGAKEKGITAGIAVGAVIALEALFAGPISGASMNPARSLAPAVVAGTPQALDHLAMVYIAGPIIGAILAVPTFALTRNVKQNSTAVKDES